MAKFDISYVIKAIDQFSPVAKEICKSSEQMDKCIRDLARKSTDLAESSVKTHKQLTSSLGSLSGAAEKADKTISQMGRHHHKSLMAKNIQKIADEAEQVSKTMQEPIAQSHKLAGGFKKSYSWLKLNKDKLAEFSDEFATSAFYKFMNVGMPLMAVTLPAFKYLSTLEQSSTALKAMVDNYGQLNKQASKLSEESTYSKADFMAAERSLASMGLSGEKIQKSMKGVMQYSAATGKDLTASAQAIASAAVSQSKVGDTDVMAMGGTASNRFVRDAMAMSSKYSGLAQSQVQTTTAQLAKSFERINTSIADIFKASSGPLITLANAAAKVVGVLSKWISNNKFLSESLGVALAACAAFLIVSATMGAVMGVASFGVSMFTGALGLMGGVVKLVTGEFKIFNKVAAIFNAILEVNPIFLIIGAIVALGVAIYECIKHWNAILAAMKAVYHFADRYLISVFKGVGNAISCIISPLDAVANKLEKVLGMSEKAKSMFSGIGSYTARIEHVIPGMGMLTPSIAPMHHASPQTHESQGSKHKVEISVNGTNAQVTSSKVMSYGDGLIPTLNTGMNYSGGY